MPVKHEILAEGVEIFLGDCREILPTLGKVDSVVTDPPFGMSFQSNYRLVDHTPILGDGSTDLLLWSTQIAAHHSKYIFCRWDNLGEMAKPKSCITWVKNNWSMGDLKHEHARQSEIILFYQGKDHFFPNGRPTDVIMGDRTGNNYHPTEKPVSLMERIVEWTAGTVVDIFCGSGSTGVACVKLGRRFTGIEINEDYYNIAKRRIQAALDAPDLFIEQPKKAEQLTF